ncbi:MAG: Rieske 2Fe-2S domain-containing protein [Acidobacteria bacterium]|nr:Rieske 2Fe-2S domain-containing protein [Acidobacteriota bacterium]
MKQNTQIALIEKVLDLVANNSTDMVAESYKQPIKDYFSLEALEKERHILFRNYPLIIAHSTQLSNPGDYLCHNETGVPIVLLRNNDGKLKAFINVCRHRGMRLVSEPSGRERRAFVCPYHAWTYDQEGELIYIPQQEGFPDLDCKEMGLINLPVVEKYGFIWVVPTPGKDLNIDEYLGNIGEDFASYGFNTHISYHLTSKRKPLNWKIGVEIFLEGYHVKQTHKKTIFPIFFDNVGVYNQFGLHMRNLFPKRKIVELKGLDKDSWNIRLYANILYYVFPNTLILVEQNHATLFSIFPLDIENSIIIVNTLLPNKPETEKAISHWQKNIDILTNATEEDFWMGEAIQKGLSSGANQHFNFARYEHSLHYFHKAISEAIKNI